MFWSVIICLGVAWVVQSTLSFRQTKAFSALFVSMRQRGRVCIGKYNGGIAQGAIVMFLLDDNALIVEGHRLHGVSVLARFRRFDDYNGVSMDDADSAEAAHLGKSVVRAVENAHANYELFSLGKEPPQPPTALARLLKRLPGPGRGEPMKLTN